MAAASSRFTQVATLSLGTTAVAAYYLLSDGGDPSVARSRVDDAVSQARDAIPVSTSLQTSEGDAKASSEDVRERATTAGLAQNGEIEPVTSNQVPDRNESPFPRRNTPYSPQDTDLHPAYHGCHTCSGPRVWFFAEKLGITRLKRRFTPYPDPDPPA